MPKVWEKYSAAGAWQPDASWQNVRQAQQPSHSAKDCNRLVTFDSTTPTHGRVDTLQPAPPQPSENTRDGAPSSARASAASSLTQPLLANANQKTDVRWLLARTAAAGVLAGIAVGSFFVPGLPVVAAIVVAAVLGTAALVCGTLAVRDAIRWLARGPADRTVDLHAPLPPSEPKQFQHEGIMVLHPEQHSPEELYVDLLRRVRTMGEWSSTTEAHALGMALNQRVHVWVPEPLPARPWWDLRQPQRLYQIACVVGPQQAAGEIHVVCSDNHWRAFEPSPQALQQARQTAVPGREIECGGNGDCFYLAAINHPNATREMVQALRDDVALQIEADQDFYTERAVNDAVASLGDYRAALGMTTSQAG